MMPAVAGLAVAGLLCQAIPPYDTHPEPLRDKVTLTLESEKSDYVVGEAVHLRLTVANTGDSVIVGSFALEPAVGRTLVHHRRPGAPFRSLRHLWVGRDTSDHWARLDPGATVSDEFVVAFDPDTSRPLLEETGEHEFWVRYSDLPGPTGLVESNVLRISVGDAPASQREALSAYRQGLAFFAEFRASQHNATPAQIQSAGEFLAKYPGSVYWKGVRDGLYDAIGERVAANVASATERELFRRLKGEWSDTDASPPLLNVSASPPGLWPPNHKLVPVVVAVTATDDQDPRPTVKLVSITCDDQCDRIADISGADIETDDREFELRSERAGTGAGRTYTITYSAEDASGNRTVAITSVVVPHDQRSGDKDRKKE